MPETIDANGEFSVLWNQYVGVLRQLVFIRSRKPPRAFLGAFETFFNETFTSLARNTLVQELSAAWSQYEADQSNRESARLLRLELVAMITGFQAVKEYFAKPAPEPRSRQQMLSRDATAKDMTSAGKTLLESILDALGDLLPSWVRGVLKILKELLDVAAGWR
jgi:hypothetical protein